MTSFFVDIKYMNVFILSDFMFVHSWIFSTKLDESIENL